MLAFERIPGAALPVHGVQQRRVMCGCGEAERQGLQLSEDEDCQASWRLPAGAKHHQAHRLPQAHHFQVIATLSGTGRE